MVREKEVAKKASSEKTVAKKKVAPKKDVAPKKVAPKKSAEKSVTTVVSRPTVSSTTATTVAATAPAPAAVVHAPKVALVKPVVREKREKAATTSHRVFGVGRRKSCVARASIFSGNGSVIINGKPVELYFKTSETSVNAIKPLIVTGTKGQFDVMVNVRGSGHVAQSDAVKLSIARALVEHDEARRIVLRQEGLLTVDSRLKERKKPGRKAARRGFQFVKR